MSLFDKIDNAPHADFNSLLRKKPKKRFLVNDSDRSKTDLQSTSQAPSPSVSTSDISTLVDAPPSSSGITDSSHDKSVTEVCNSVHESNSRAITNSSHDKTVSLTKMSQDVNVTNRSITESSQDASVIPTNSTSSTNDETVILGSKFEYTPSKLNGLTDPYFSVESESKLNVNPILDKSHSQSVSDIGNFSPSPLPSPNFPPREEAITVSSHDKSVTLTPSSQDNNVTLSYSQSPKDRDSDITHSSHDESVSVIKSSFGENRENSDLSNNQQRGKSITLSSQDNKTRLTESSYKNTEGRLSSEIDLPRKVLIKTNFTKCPNNFSENLKKLSKAARILYRYLFRISYGWNQNTTSIPVSFGHLDKKLSFSRLTLFQNFKELEEHKLIEKEIFQSNRGHIFRVRYYDSDGKLTEAPIQKNFFCLDNNFFEIHQILKKSEQDVYLYLYEQSYGRNRNITNRYISTTEDIAPSIDLSARRTLDALRGLCDKNLIKRLDRNSNLHYRYRVFLPHEVLSTEIIPNLEVSEETAVTVSTQDKIISVTGTSRDDFSEPATVSSQDETVIQNNTNSFQEDAVITKSSQDETVNKERDTNLKTSSSADDEIFKFISQQTSTHPCFSFPISKKKISQLLENYETEHLKKTFLKLLPSLMREGVGNPVGMYLHAVEQPDSYAVLQKPSTQEIADKKRIENQIELREKAFADEFKRIIDSKQEVFWNALDERIREEALAKRRSEMGQVGELKIPEVAIKRSAMDRVFWDKHNQTWQTLTAEERATHAGNMKQTIIKRVYAGEGRAVPNPLPERDFLKSLDELAERLAMISAGKGGAK